MTIPSPGWYIDPENAEQLRWWSGESWTEHKSPNPQASADAPAAVEVLDPSYVPMGNRYAASGTDEVKLTHREKDKLVRRHNSFAYTGCVLSLIAFLFNPFAVLSILGIVFSAIGLAKSHELDGRSRVTGRGTAIAGIILGLVGLAAFAWAISRQYV